MAKTQFQSAWLKYRTTTTFFFIVFLRDHDRVVTIKSWNFSIAKVWCCMDLYWSTRGCNLAAHSSIHASFILRRGLTRFQLPKGFLGLRIIEWRNSSDILEWGPGAKQTGNITLIALNVSPDWITPEVHIAGNRRPSLLVHLSSLRYHSLGSIHLKLLSCWVERMPLCPPTSVRWS